MVFNYYFDNDIEEQAVVELVNVIQDKDEVVIHFTTFGGSTVVMDYLISVLNSLGDKVTVNIVFCLVSAGTLLLTDYKGKITIDKNIEYMLFHKIDREIYTRRKQKVSVEILGKQLDYDSKIFAKKLKEKGILTKKQIKNFNNGKDVVLYRSSIMKLKL